MFLAGDIRLARPDDWASFLRLAELEGWRVPQIERWLFAGPLARQALVLEVDGDFAGLVTAVAHSRSGWIGNLLVPQPLRGRGHGRRLFEAALKALLEAQPQRIWLTASDQGLALYQQAGFRVVEQIERWIRPPGPAGPKTAVCKSTREILQAKDRVAWEEDRGTLLDWLVERGEVYSCLESVALLQAGDDLQVIGPWLTGDQCPRANRQLLQALLGAADPSVEIVCDVLASSSLRGLLAASGFAPAGHTRLMLYGESRQVALGQVVALASLGSIG